jgi:hypothetical protein
LDLNPVQVCKIKEFVASIVDSYPVQPASISRKIKAGIKGITSSLEDLKDLVGTPMQFKL